MSRPARIRTREWEPCELYDAYEAARDEAGLALADWRSAASAVKCEAFAVYRAAADREDAAALAWMRACRAYDAEHARAA